MNIHEYQAKALLADYGVATLKCRVAYTPEEAEAFGYIAAQLRAASPEATGA